MFILPVVSIDSAVRFSVVVAYIDSVDISDRVSSNIVVDSACRM